MKSYDRAIEELDEEYAKKKAEAKETANAGLREALKTALDAKNDDEVKRISAVLAGDSSGKSAGKQPGVRKPKDSGQPLPSSDESKKLLELLHPDKQFLTFIAGKSCRVAMNNAQGFGIWKFNADGVLIVDNNPIGRWSVVGDRKVVTLINNGDYIDLFQFSSDGESFEVAHIGNGAKTSKTSGTVLK